MSNPVKFLYLQQEDVIACGALDIAEVIQAVEKVYALHEQGQCIEPEAPLISWDGPHGRRILAHPAWVGGDVDVAGIKWIPSNPENPRKRGMPRASAIIILNDPETGYPLAVMDGTVISAARTGAATGVGAKYLMARRISPSLPRLKHLSAKQTSWSQSLRVCHWTAPTSKQAGSRKVFSSPQ